MRPILIAAYGSLVSAAANDYQALGAAITQAFPERECRWAWTSGAVLEGLKERGDPAPAVAEVFAQMENPVVLSAHLGPGAMHRGLVEQVGHATPPILEGADGVEAVAQALAQEMDPGVINVVVGHGSKRARALNDAYLPVIDRLAQLVPESVVWDWGTFDGPPGDGVCERLAPQVQGGAVRFLPLLLVAGGHVAEDLQGSQPESWTNRLGAGSVTVAPSLANSPRVQGLLVERIRAD